jgi:hypothetical protein
MLNYQQISTGPTLPALPFITHTLGHAVALLVEATSQKIAGSSADEVIGFSN